MSPLRALWLDYQRPLPGRQWPGIALLSVGFLLSGLLLAESYSLAGELALGEQQVTKLKREAERRRVLASLSRQSPEAGLSEQRLPSPSAARWESLFAALENAGNDSVTLLALEPGSGSGSGSAEISLTGEAKDMGASLDYVKRLQTSRVFADAHLVKHEIVKDHPYRPVRFTLQATWR